MVESFQVYGHFFKNNIISYHITWWTGLSYHVISDHNITYHIISYHKIIVSHRVASYHIISYHIISFHFLSYHIIPCVVFFSRPPTCLILPYPIPHLLRSDPILSNLIQSYSASAHLTLLMPSAHSSCYVNTASTTNTIMILGTVGCL